MAGKGQKMRRRATGAGGFGRIQGKARGKEIQRRTTLPYRPAGVLGYTSNEEQLASSKRPARNAPCPCGSGAKFKRCCLGRLHAGVDQEAAPGSANDEVEDGGQGLNDHPLDDVGGAGDHDRVED